MKKRNIFISAALVLVGILAFCFAINKAAELKEYQKTSCMKLEHEIDAVSAEQAAIDFMKNEKKQLVFWSKERTGACENPMFNRSMKMKEMIFCGELSLLLPECGSTGERGESQECIVDEEASLQLFGNKNATGQMIELGGKKIYDLSYDQRRRRGCDTKGGNRRAAAICINKGKARRKSRGDTETHNELWDCRRRNHAVAVLLYRQSDSWLNSGCLWCLGSSSAVKYMERGEAKDKDWVVRKRFCRSGCRNSYTLDLYEAFSAGTWNFSLSVI